MSLPIKNPEILQLKQIVNGAHGEEMQLKLLKEFQLKYSLQKFEILTKLCELIPLTTSLLSVKEILIVFARNLVTVLEELNVLESSELSQDAIKHLKSFWSLCSSQQNFLSSTQLFGKWNSELLELITPLASVFIDLSISAYGQKENLSFWSKKLYSWLTFDLSERAIKVALLEVTGHTRDGAEIAGTLLRQVLTRKYISSCADYLLHFLLVKKWKHVCDFTEISKSLKAPSSFLDWLKTYWRDADDYIPDDKSLKGSQVSQFLLDLDTDQVLEPLTDALQMAVFPENVQNESATVDYFDSDSCFFVLDKEGEGQKKSEKKSHGEDGNDMTVIKSQRKRDVREILDTPKKTRRSLEITDSDEMEVEEEVSTPRKKKRKTEADVNSTNLGFTLDRGSAKTKSEEFIEIEDDEDEEEKHSDDSDVEAMEDEENNDDEENNNGQEEPKLKKQKQILSDEHESITSDSSDAEIGNEEFSENSNDSENNESGSSDVIEVETDGSDEKDKPRPGNMAAAVLKRKNILISDPVATSYFINGVEDKQVKGNEIQVFEITDEVDKNPGGDSNNLHGEVNEQRSLQKLQSFSENDCIKINVNPKKNKTPQKVTKSPQKKTESPKKKPIKLSEPVMIDDDSDNEVVTVDQETPKHNSTCIVNYVTVEDGGMEVEKRRAAIARKETNQTSMVDEIAVKISAIRKSTKPSTPVRLLSTSNTENDTPTRRSTRIRLCPDNKKETTPSKKSDLSSSLLKDWLRSPSDNGCMKNDDDSDDVKKSNKALLMTKIKDRYLKETTIDDDDNSRKESQSSPVKKNKYEKPERGDLTESDVFPTPSKKTYSKRDRKLSEKLLKSNESPKSLKQTPKNVPECSEQTQEGEKVENEQETKDSNESCKITDYFLRQRTKSEPKLVQTTLTPGKKSLSKIDQTVSSPSAFKDEKKKDMASGEEKVKTPSRRKSIKGADSVTTRKEGDVEKKSPKPSPANRRKSLRSAKH